MNLMEIMLHPLVIGPLGYFLGSIIGPLIKDKLLPFSHKNQSLEFLKNQVKPQISLFTIKTADDLQLFSKRISACGKLYKGEISMIGSGVAASFVLELKSLKVCDIDVKSGNLRMIHVENFSDYSCNIKEICDANKNPISYKCPDLSYVEKNDSIGIVINAYIALSKISVDFNGHVFVYTISEKDGSIDPIVK